MTAAIGVSLLAVAGFALALRASRVDRTVDRALDQALAGLMTMLDGGMHDDAKEVAVRRAGFALVAAAFGLLWRLGVALAVAAVPVLTADALGLAPRDDVLALMLRLDWILAVSVAAVGVGALARRWRPPAEPADGATTTPYSRPDRLLHGVAFAHPRVLTAASRVEDRLVSSAADTPSAPPILVTSLARGGTTALLNALHDVPGVATHTYRDMPFLTAPTLWNRVAGGSRRRVDRHERAHGDGLEIDLDSPEAFEEVVWRLFWPEKYGATIALWTAQDRRPDAEDFLARHMGKVVHARRVQAGDDVATPTRYCSKNNATIARLSYLQAAFPDARVVVPVRRPECHAASLLRQHRNFLERQAEDDFVRRYMRDLGHLEFGLAHAPMAFPGFDPGRYDPTTGDYWLHYWVQAFREVARHADRCLLVTQDDLRARPHETMTSLCDALELDPAPSPWEAYVRSGRDEAPTDGFDPRLLAEAQELYRELETTALRGAPTTQRGLR